MASIARIQSPCLFLTRCPQMASTGPVLSTVDWQQGVGVSLSRLTPRLKTGRSLPPSLGS